MIEAISRVLLWLALGEAIARGAGLPVPGAVVGLLLLYGDLARAGDVPRPLAELADGGLRHLAIVFVPAGVGVTAHLELLRDDLLPILAAVVGGTLVTVALTAVAVERLGAPRPAPDRPAPIGSAAHDADA